MQNHHLERALFVVAARHRGKSTQLRSMFRDVRFGTDGHIPTQLKLDDFHRLSNDRFLYLRLSSPHELKETINGFLKKTEAKIKAANAELGRHWNFAGALHSHAFNKMPDVVETCKWFVRHFEPERTRVVFLNPDRKENVQPEDELLRFSRRLRRINSVEVIWIDARDTEGNGLILSEFFAF
jgi:hypothetical protein